jgi:DNA repair exonuclease SbcCD ATPase subunit
MREITTEELKELELKELFRTLRTLQWRLKQRNKEGGVQGKRIYELRCENAALRQALTVDPSNYNNLLAQLRETRRDLETSEAEKKELKERLAEAES